MRENAAIRAAMAKGMVEEHVQRRIPPPLTIPLDITEVVFQEYVIEAAHYYGWKVAHFRRVHIVRADGTTYHETPAAVDGSGWPDLALARPRRFIVAELKAKKNRESPEQTDWRRLLETSIECYLWHPRDWSDILRILA